MLREFRNAMSFVSESFEAFWRIFVFSLIPHLNKGVQAVLFMTSVSLERIHHTYSTKKISFLPLFLNFLFKLQKLRKRSLFFELEFLFLF